MVEARHPIRVVSRRTGVSQDLLRAWERRYSAVIPGRSSTGRRLYSDQDISRLTLIKRAVDAGRRISDVANLTLAQLRDMVREDRDAISSAPPMQRSRMQSPGQRQAAENAGPLLAACLQAVADLDKERLTEHLAKASVDLSSPMLRNEVLVPLLREIGERWRDGSLRVAHEHLASVVVRSHLGTLRDGNLPSEGSPRLVVSTPAGQLHEFGALMAATAAIESGWEVIYLGPNLPAEEIAAAARQKDAHAVALSVIFPGSDPRLGEEFRKLRDYLGPDIPILVGGRSASAYLDVFTDIGALYMENLDVLQTQLEKLAG